MRFKTALAILLSASPALAASPEGTFKRGGSDPITATVMALDGDQPFAARFTTGQPEDPSRCSGVFAATGRMERPDRIVFSGKLEFSTLCRITLKFNHEFNQATIEEDGCGDYHGSSCDFNGSLRRGR